MANDVSIIVSAELGDTLIKLDLAKHAINDLGDASEETAAKEDFMAASTDNLTFSESAAAAATTLFDGALQSLGVPLVAVAALIAGAAVGAVALADALGTVVAIATAFIAPLSVVTGLLGLLAGGFFLAAKKAMGMHEDGLGQAVSDLKKQFDDLTTTLVGRFMPIFRFLIHDASQALDFLGKIAKLPLDQAFKKLAQQGVPAVKQFLDQIGHLIAHPIRLAFQIAFGNGRAGNEAAAAVSQIWNELSNFLFGYSKTHKIHIGRALIVTQDEANGIFQPLIDWFNRHHFTKDGTRIGHEILNGLKPLAAPIGQFIVAIFKDAFKTVLSNGVNMFHQLVSAANREWDHLTSELTADMHRWNSEFESFVLSPFISGWHRIGGAIDDVKGIAEEFLSVLQEIAGFFSRTFTLHVNFPSLPSLGGIASGIGGALGGIPHLAGRAIMHNEFHFHGSSDRAAFRRQVHEIGRELARQQHILAGGV